MLVDSHAHLEVSTSPRGLRGASIDDLEGVLARAKESGVEKIVTIGTSIDSSKKAIEIAQQYSTNDLQSFATCGLHPKDAASDIHQNPLHYNSVLESIVLSSDKIVAIGECGLDYYLGSMSQGSETSEKEKEFQRELFEAQSKLACDLNLPLIIHCRNAWYDIFDLITTTIPNRGLTPKGVFHSWTGDWDTAKKALGLGFYISFSGIVTFGNARDIQEVAKKMPIDRMLVETDSPFLAPEPLRSAQGKLGRGKTNEPKNVKIIAKFLADIRHQSVDLICQQTYANANRLFRLK